MNKKIFVSIIALFIIVFSFSQVDRSKPPKALDARAINFGKVEQFTLSNGLKVIIVENHKLPTVRFDLYLDRESIFEGEKAGFLSMFGDMMRAGTKNFTKEQLDEKIDFLGTDFWTGSNGFGFSALKKQLNPSLDILNELLFNSTFTNASELEKLKKQAKTGLESQAKNPDAISGRVSNAVLYGKNDPYGEFETAESIDKIDLQVFKSYYENYVKPNIAYLIISGDITMTEAKPLVEKYFAKWQKGDVKQPKFALPIQSKGISIALIDLPTATQSNIKISSLNNLKKSNKNYFASILGNEILGGGSFGRLFKNIREKHGWTYGAYSRLSDDYKRLGSFSASAKVRNNVTDSAVVEFMKEIKAITSVVPDVKELDIKKSEYNGNFALALERPETSASFVRTQLLENLGNDFYKNYLKNINAVSATQIPVTMKEFIDPDNVTIFIVGKAEEIYPKLKTLGYPIQFYDTFGNIIPNPTEKKSAGNITAEQVVDKYLALCGGKDKLKTISTLFVNSTVSSPQIPVPMTSLEKLKAPNFVNREINANGMTMMKETFDGQAGYNIQQGQKKEFTAEELKDHKETNTIFPQLYHDVKGKTVEMKAVNGEDCYKIVISPKRTEYYNVKTGFLVREEVKNVSPQGEMILTIDSSNYKEVNGIKYPYTGNVDFGGQFAMKFEVTELKINSDVIDSDFK